MQRYRAARESYTQMTFHAQWPRARIQNMHNNRHAIYSAITQILGSAANKDDYYSHPTCFFFHLRQ